MEINDVPIAVWATVEEMKLRGMYLSMAADVDFTISYAIIKCYNLNQKEVEALYDKTFDRFTLAEKLGALKEGLKKYHPDLYELHEDDFDTITPLRLIRNRFAHGKIVWIDKENLEILEIKRTQIKTTKYKVKDLWNFMAGFRPIVMNFLQLVNKFIDDHPAVIQQLE